MKLALFLVPIALAAAAGCSTDPGNHYGTGGSTGFIQAVDVNSGLKHGSTHFVIRVESISIPIEVGDVASFKNLNPGDYVVALDSLANCVVTNSNPQSAHVDAGYITYLTFNTTCS